MTAGQPGGAGAVLSTSVAGTSLGRALLADQVAFVFIREAGAHTHLPEIWLHGLECWAIVDGVHVRLDADYHPEPHPPAWVEALARK